jgi:hypothetical protein
MSAAQLRTRRALRGGALLAGLLGTGAGLVWLVGAPATLVGTLAGAGDLGADPVEVVLAAMTLLAEGLTAYLLVVVTLAVAGQLPGLFGQLAEAALRTIGLPAVRRAVEAALGGVLAIGLLAGPVAASASAQSRPSPAVGAVAAGARSAAAGAVTGTAGAHLPRPPEAGAAPPTTAPSPAATGATWATTPGGGATRSAPITRSSGEGDGSGQGGLASPHPGPSTGGRAADAVPDASDHPQAGAPAANPAPSEPRPAARAEPAADGIVHVVRPGDTLWDIAAAQLPAGSRDNAVIASQWQRIYTANRATIGENPDLILPGTRLVLPPPAPGAGRGSPRD